MQCCIVRPTKIWLFCKTSPPVLFTMRKFQKQNFVHFVSQQKTRSPAVVFDVALGVRPIRNNTFEINWYIALLPNPVGSTAKTSLPWHTIQWMHSLCSSLRALWTKLSREAFKADKSSLSSLAFIRRHDGNHQLAGFLWSKVTLPHRKPINGLVLSTFCFLTNQRKVQILD